jgi:hypothetical protein
MGVRSLKRLVRGKIRGRPAPYTRTSTAAARDDGTLKIVPLVPRECRHQGDYLPLTRANILRQAFKFLGNAMAGVTHTMRDCAGSFPTCTAAWAWDAAQHATRP